MTKIEAAAFTIGLILMLWLGVIILSSCATPYNYGVCTVNDKLQGLCR